MIAVFLAALASGISEKTRSAVAPPVYDPISYYEKASLVWKAIAKRKPLQIMNKLAIRPPGSALILYPFGFKFSMASFLFRSVMAPLVIWSLALMILVLPLVRSRSDAILGGALVVGLLSMPVFYHFQITEFFAQAYHVTNQWGLVDAQLGAVAALALGLISIGIRKSSLTLCLLGWLVGSYTIFIKPSGILVMLTLFGVAMVEFFLRYHREVEQRRSILKTGLIAFAVGSLLFGISLWIAFHTEYLGSGAIAMARTSQTTVIQMVKTDLATLLSYFIRPVIGWWWFCPMVLILAGLVIEAFRSFLKQRLSAMGLRLVASFLIAAAAIWWWLNLAGPEHRYLFPFLMMIIAWLVPDVFERLKHFAPAPKLFIVVYCFIPGCVLAGMLQLRQPDPRLQIMMGVDLAYSEYADEVKWGEWLVDQSQKLQRPLNIYTVNNGFRAGVVEMVTWVASIKHPKHLQLCKFDRPNSWRANPGLVVPDIIKSDYLVVDAKISNDSSDILKNISDWQDEGIQFQQFAYCHRGVDRNGLELVSDGPLKILRIVDARKFEDEISKWIQSIQWGNDFLERNKSFLEAHGMANLPLEKGK